MMPWFVWKDKNSLADFGIWINKLPKRVRAEERHEEIEIPGRAGSLIMLEGDDVYSSYTAEMTIIARNTLHIDMIVEWLRGSSDLILSTDMNKVRAARIVGEVAFERIGNDLMQAVVPFLFQPFKKNRYPLEDRLTIGGASATITNPGDVASKPSVAINGTGNNTITIAGKEMSFTNLSGVVVVDCDAQIITKNNQIWTNSVTGDFWEIPRGTSEITQTGNAVIQVYPGWRWL